MRFLALCDGEEPYALVVLLHGGGKGDGHWGSGAGMFMGPFRKSLGRAIFLRTTGCGIGAELISERHPWRIRRRWRLAPLLTFANKGRIGRFS
jgi:hypothetical protein